MEPCDFDHPHPEHPCGRRVIPGVTWCTHCGNLDGSSECAAAGCWQPATEEDVDALYLEAWGLAPEDRRSERCPFWAKDGELMECPGGSYDPARRYSGNPAHPCWGWCFHTRMLEMRALIERANRATDERGEG